MGWANPVEYDEGEDPFDPFSNYQHGNGYENGVDSVTQRLQAVGFDYLIIFSLTSLWPFLSPGRPTLISSRFFY